MKLQTLLAALMLFTLVGCSDTASFSEFPLKTKFEMHTKDFQTVEGKTTSFRSYLTPYARLEREGATVLFGFIFHEEDYIEGVAYLTDKAGKVIDSLLVCDLDVPNDLWAEVENGIMLLESGGMMEDGPFPPGRTSDSWVDTVRYSIGASGFVLIK